MRRERFFAFTLLGILLSLFVTSCNQNSTNLQEPIQTAPLEAVGLYGEYFLGEDFSGLTRRQIDNQLDFDWGTAAPVLDFPVGTFSARWTGYLKVNKSGEYSFDLKSSGESELYLNNKVIKNGQSISLDKANHSIKVEFSKTTEDASLSLSWSSSILSTLDSAQIKKQSAKPNLIPQTNLIPSKTIEPESFLKSRSDKNLLKNGGFEHNLSHWHIYYQENTNDVSMTTDTYEGKSLRLTNYAWLQQDLPYSDVHAGKTYTLSAVGKTNSECYVGSWVGNSMVKW